MSLLNPTLWLVAIAILAGSSGLTYLKGRTDGTKICEAVHAKAAIAANEESRRLEQARQRRADESAKLAAARTNRLAADNRRAHSELDRLRDTIRAPKPTGDESCTAANQRADTAERLLLESGELLTEIAGAADRHASDVKLLLDSWPR